MCQGNCENATHANLLHEYMTSKYFRFTSVIYKRNSSFQQILILWQSICIDMAKRKLMSNKCAILPCKHINTYMPYICMRLVVHLLLSGKLLLAHNEFQFYQQVCSKCNSTQILLWWRNPLENYLPLHALCLSWSLTSSINSQNKYSWLYFCM